MENVIFKISDSRDSNAREDWFFRKVKVKIKGLQFFILASL